MSQFIGSQVRIITKNKNRFEGKIDKLEVDTGVLLLSNVRIFGTEERDAPKFCPGSANIYKAITFKASEIDDIKVLSSSQPPPNVFADDPAIVSCSTLPPFEPSLDTVNVVGEGAKVYGSPSPVTSPASSEHTVHQHRGARYGGQRHNNYQPPRDESPTSSRGAADVADDYDFDKANLQFHKLFNRFTTLAVDEEGKEGSEEENGYEQQPIGVSNAQASSYDKKKSFFDCLSCKDTAEQPDVDARRLARRKETIQNNETFGLVRADPGRPPYNMSRERQSYQSHHRPGPHSHQQQNYYHHDDRVENDMK